jgi:DNA-binding LytR/AlgR family response regulator
MEETLRILIVEDEALAAERLELLVKQCLPKAKILASTEAISDTVAWLEKNRPPDLAFFDIQLADGLSFKIFERTTVGFPVIFTTAFDEYALKAFKVNSIDYLLKPVGKEELQAALDKYRSLRNQFGGPDLELIRQTMSFISGKKEYKSRFVVKSGHQLAAIPVEEIGYFFSEHKTTWLKTFAGKKHAVDMPLEQLEEVLDPSVFFRINRKYFVSFPAIRENTAYSGSRLKLSLHPGESKEPILVSREKVSDFKEWLDQ